jgi:DNA-binding CsgD family transcriptional regulator
MPAAIIGREDELGSIEAFLARVRRGPSALVLSGEPGVGKTILWQAGVEQAQEQAYRVLRCRGIEAEVTLSFASLSDLLADVLEEALHSLVAPRRRALEVALLLEEPGEAPPDPRGVALAFLDALRALAESEPIVVAVDDLQWLDTSSAGVLQFALRRLRNERVGFLGTVRRAHERRLPLDLEHSLPEGAPRLSLGPLSLGALHHLLKERLGLELARPTLVRLQEATGGNPFFSLELGRELMRSGARQGPGRRLAVSEDLGRLLGERLSRLPPETGELLLSAAALARPTLEVLAAAHGSRGRTEKELERAEAAGILELYGSRVRFAHPLLASVCYQEVPVWRRRAAHARLAAAVVDEEERARHLALAAEGPDAGVASALDAAAELATDRGATAAAAALSELAAELTPPEYPEEGRRRRLAAARFHRLAGDRDRAAEILEGLLVEAPSGTERADVLFALASGRQGELPSITGLCEQALVEAEGDDARGARILGFLSWMRLLGGDVRGALAASRQGLEKAERVGHDSLLARAIARVSMAETWALEITPGLVERGVEIEERLGAPLEFHESPTVALARRLISLGELTRARSLIFRAEAKAAAAGDEGTRGHLLFHLVMLEWFAGRWETALRHATAALELAEQLRDEQYRGMVLHAKALVDAHLGRVESARAAAEEAAVIAEAVSDAVFAIWNQSVLGNLEFALGNEDAAGEHLRALPGRLLSLGWNDPGNVWPNAIQALIALGELDQARAYLEQYEGLARRSTSAWALAIASRCRGLLAAAEGDLDAAFAAFERALDEHERTEGRFELGRTLLGLGSVRRRARQKRAAREAIEQALAIFEELGARLWSERAREELGRVSGRRRSAPGELTKTEDRVAALAARGLSNKEIASTLYVSPHTVEAHLSSIYRKLGVRSRSALAGRLATPPDSVPKM